MKTEEEMLEIKELLRVVKLATAFTICIFVGCAAYGHKYGFGAQCEASGFVANTSEYNDCVRSKVKGA